MSETAFTPNNYSQKSDSFTIQSAIGELEDSLPLLRDLMQKLEMKLAGFMDCPPCVESMPSPPQPSCSALVRRVLDAKTAVRGVTSDLQRIINTVQIGG